jgi:hypothetical protein
MKEVSTSGHMLKNKEQQFVLNVFNCIKSNNLKKVISWILSELKTIGILRISVYIKCLHNNLFGKLCIFVSSCKSRSTISA